MNSCDQVRSHLLEHLYGLLEEPDAHALTDHMNQCAHCREELVHAQEQMALIAAAAKEEFPQVRFVPPVFETPQSHQSPRRFITRWAVAAAILIAAAGLGVPSAAYWQRHEQVTQAENTFQRAKDQLAQTELQRLRIMDESERMKTVFRMRLDQADKSAEKARDALVQLGQEYGQKIKQANLEVNAKQMDLTVVGPRAIEPGALNQFQIQTRTLRQQPLPAQVSVILRDQNQREIFKEDKASSSGNLLVTLPRDLPLKPDTALTLEVQASAEQGQPTVLSESLPLTGPVYVTHLATDG
jgi:hypothetical protein